MTETVKLIPQHFSKEHVTNMLLNSCGNEVFIEFGTCELCGTKYISTYHDDPGQNPIELAISYCGGCE